jgi:hypothetical protein
MEFQKMELIAMINSGCLGFRLDDVATELDQLRSGIDFSLKYRACKNHQKVADDFCVLAARYRLKIFETARSNQNINHPAKDVMKTLDLLVSKIDKLNERNGWKLDCFKEPYSPLDKFVFTYCGDGGELSVSRLTAIRKELELVLIKNFKYDDDLFRKFARATFKNLLSDLLKLMHVSGLKMHFSNEIEVIDRNSLFFVFLKIFEFCEYEFDRVKFNWLPWVRGNPIKIPCYSDVNSIEPVAYEVIDVKGVGVVGDLYALHGCGEFDEVIFRGELPNFSR